ncbi:MAG: LEM-3-like GIY-YIG domain-containing protein [Chloroflexota bacterium]
MLVRAESPVAIVPVQALEAHDAETVPVTSTIDEAFPPEVAVKLGTYVYRLIDPRNGETFYIGKGKGNRVFAHIQAAQALEGDALENKIRRIREIHLAGFQVAHVIHRHGMDDKTAFEVESALMDAYPGLTNIAGGHGGSEFGAMHAREIMRRYSAESAVFQHKALLISVNRSSSERSLYDATRWAWRISKLRAEQAEVVLATMQGLIVGAFIADKWMDANAENFPGSLDEPGRLGFVGRDAPEEMQRLYVGKRVPDELRRRGAANPIKYTW